ncbi:hypothetical protein EDB87DRAFT_1683562 [Lactarius vividus]|nr:hypothetical protein EDB87DRAFT_1683562 [Lactarius vividus]
MTDYQGRQLLIDFTLIPYYGQTPLSFAAAQQTLQLSYLVTLLYYERGGMETTDLDTQGKHAVRTSAVHNCVSRTNTSRYTRLLSYDISRASTKRPSLVGGVPRTRLPVTLDLILTVGATDIHATSSDSPGHPIAPGGVLSSCIVPATYVSFVDYLDSGQQARFGLHNGGSSSQTLIDAKWEPLAPSVRSAALDDYSLP